MPVSSLAVPLFSRAFPFILWAFRISKNKGLSYRTPKDRILVTRTAHQAEDDKV